MMNNELYCPMKMTSNPLGRCVCEKEKCAWWRQLDNCCSVWWIARKLDGIEADEDDKSIRSDIEQELGMATHYFETVSYSENGFPDKWRGDEHEQLD